MILKWFINILFAFAVFSISAQNMQPGFTYLETGKYPEAKSFFESILKDYPENKTARLCYGRAIGLGGNSEKAKQLFLDLLEDHPDDFEVKLNYGESLLWNQNFIDAKPYFRQLIEADPNSFPALLSYANTLSNLKEYEDALLYVDKALDLSPGNANALNSKKYMYLGFAYQKQQAQQYDEAESLLKENLKLFNNDKDTLLNLANLYLIADRKKDAKAVYHLLGENPENKLIALNGLALVSHLDGKEKEALKISTEAFDQLGSTTAQELVKATTERYIQALIWNKKYKPAEELIDGLRQEKPNENWVLALRATLNIYKSNFKNSLSDYNNILRNDSTSFDGNLGKANTLKALGRFKEAYISAENTLSYYTNQKDAKKFIKELNSGFTPFIESKTLYSFDNGDNEAYAIQNNINFPLSTKFKILANYNYRTTSNKVTDAKATSNDFSLGLNYMFLPQITFKGIAGLTSVDTNTDAFTNLLTDISVNIRSFKLQVLDVGYQRKTENFNAALLERELIQNSYYLNYNLSTNFKLGWFTQYIFTSQSDDNTRNLFFTSLYYNFLSDPSLKAGINYQHIAFKDQVPVIYFSPKRFNVVEVFVDLLKNQNSKWMYSLNAAAGLQFIEDNEAQNTFRFQGKLGHTFSNRFMANIYGQYSDIASTTAAGFNYTELGIQLRWYLFKKPVFR
ncbi:MAG: tetratricopeptide repeat protein [Flavobacteriaceae bacterium]|nr:tetratricopeptide repeat protein [Flavobacteriaceae bacterium]